jgi:hypothetical protein
MLFKFLFVAFINSYSFNWFAFFRALWEFSISPNTILILPYHDLVVGFGYFSCPKQLIKPIEVASMALRSYKEERQVQTCH